MGFTTPGTDNEAIRGTRDLLEKLSKEIQESNKASVKLNRSMFWLTVIMVIMAVIEFFKTAGY